MASQKSNNNPTESRTNSAEIKKNKSKGSKVGTQLSDKTKPKIRFKKAKKISKSIKRIESEMSHIQIQMEKIGNDLATVLQLIETKKKN